MSADFMINQNYLIDIVPNRQPYNARFVLPLEWLERLMPVLQNEIMFGIVDTDGNDRVVLDLFLSEAKIEEINEFIKKTGGGVLPV
ncbi:MAG TPA: hypothetical protein VEY06_03745 [Flavisolibacter sp.]|nr:hypothetical protein [Flavisolibacter sp.]